MPNIRKPRSGSMQFWPRKRAKRVYARVRSWLSKKEPGMLGFAGYKVGMADIIITDNSKASLTKGHDIIWPVTIVECPPMKVASARFYKKTVHGKKVATEVGMRLGQASEFSLLVASIAISTSLISDIAASLIQATTILTFIVSSYIVVLRYPTPIALSDDMRKD